MMVKVPLLKSLQVQTDENVTGNYVKMNDIYAVIKLVISRKNEHLHFKKCQKTIEREVRVSVCSMLVYVYSCRKQNICQG